MTPFCDVDNPTICLSADLQQLGQKGAWGWGPWVLKQGTYLAPLSWPSPPPHPTETCDPTVPVNFTPWC